jgi:hypothetical protein
MLCRVFNPSTVAPHPIIKRQGRLTAHQTQGADNDGHKHTAGRVLAGGPAIRRVFCLSQAVAGGASDA